MVATPIGNLEDVTFRAVEVLKSVDLVAAEDTRRARILFQRYDVHAPLTSYHDMNETSKSKFLLEKLREGLRIALISDAGTPGISDPGFDIVRAAVSEGIPVVPIPGPTAAISLLSVSGLPTDRFVFEGFLPRKEGKRMSVLAEIRDQPRTVILYESPKRLIRTLQEIHQVMGEREIVVGRELTKQFEEILRGPVHEVLQKLGGRSVKGEITLLIKGNK